MDNGEEKEPPILGRLMEALEVISEIPGIENCTQAIVIVCGEGKAHIASSGVEDVDVVRLLRKVTAMRIEQLKSMPGRAH